ncbi:MAG: hypothetical protein HWE30_01525 [Methylocystaceae bacterium]|nr:hypothetical protein [Methylocystaceae bacterium]
MDINDRRALLKTSDNPNKSIDYITSLERELSAEKLRLTLRYIPDKVVLNAACFAPYMEMVLSHSDMLEEAATIILEDLNNELVARWVQVLIYKGKGQENQHCVILEDQQPQWSNPHLMARISKI